MAVDKGLVAHILEQLQPIGGISGKPMFGGYGVWHDGQMFTLFDGDTTCYFKVDDSTRAAYEAAGSTPFTPPMPKGRAPMTMPYYVVPAAVLDDGAQLREWAHAAIAVAHAAPPPRTRARPKA